MSSQPFDLAKLDFKTIRRQERRKLLVRSAVPVVLVFIVALWFLLPTILTGRAIGNYKHEKNSAARRWLTPLTLTSPEPFVIAFNSGTVDTKQGKYDRAEKELTRAVAIAPEDKRCMAAQNLVISLKAHAESIKSNTKEATVLETKATSVMNANQICFKGSAASGGASASSDSAAQSQAPTDAQQQQLQQKEQEGRDRKAQFARDETFNESDPKIKPW